MVVNLLNQEISFLQNMRRFQVISMFFDWTSHKLTKD